MPIENGQIFKWSGKVRADKKYPDLRAYRGLMDKKYSEMKSVGLLSMEKIRKFLLGNERGVE